MPKRFSKIILLIFISNLSLYSQNITLEALKERFNFEVKSMDDFFARFNNDHEKSTFFNYLKEVYKVEQIPREIMIRSLLSKSAEAKDSLELGEFLADLASAETQESWMLDYYYSNWYAQIECDFLINDKIVTYLLTLKIIRATDNGGMCWTIIASDGKNERMLESQKEEHVSMSNYYAKGPSRNLFISPVSHALNFIDLYRIFDNNREIGLVFSRRNCKENCDQLIVNLLNSNTYCLKKIRKIKYFLFIDRKWMIISSFDQRPNSSRVNGWTIESLTQIINDKHFSDLKRERLNIN